ncbi:Histidinol-phosphatase [Mycena sanguinolenta]|uniref:Histidinol-phosphatase n=1 Tax=Mycena sanguinolenta TaxID=230812 RepID=A0A8H7CGJ9_9AGAR|nr:Histidinol-phosphatase [Mycena sanguinolenta]
MNAIPIDLDLMTFQKALDSIDGTIEPHAGQDGALLSTYFDAQYEVFQRFSPEVIGHMDLCRLYNPTLQLSKYPEALERAKWNILYAMEYGALFEINAAAPRKNWETPHAGLDLLQIILEHGGHLTLSDDSHGSPTVGLNYARIPEYLQRAGATELWFLEHSDTHNASGRNSRAVKMDRHWADHPFWALFS